MLDMLDMNILGNELPARKNAEPPFPNPSARGLPRASHVLRHTTSRLHLSGFLGADVNFELLVSDCENKNWRIAPLQTISKRAASLFSRLWLTRTREGKPYLGDSCPIRGLFCAHPQSGGGLRATTVLASPSTRNASDATSPTVYPQRGKDTQP